MGTNTTVTGKEKSILHKQFMLVFAIGLGLYKFLMINIISYSFIEIINSTIAAFISSILLGHFKPDLSLKKAFLFNFLMYLVFPFIEMETRIFFSWPEYPSTFDYIWAYFMGYYVRIFNPLTIIIGVIGVQVGKAVSKITLRVK